MKTGVTHLPLHGGRAPAWLFSRMVLLAREIVLVTVEEYGPGEVLRRLSIRSGSRPSGCVLGFDWHSSGVTTTTCGALKEGIEGMERELGLFVAGGKGRLAQTPGEIQSARAPALGPDAPRLCQPHVGQGGQRRRPGRLPALPPRFSLHARGQLGGRPAGHERREPDYARRYHWLGKRCRTSSASRMRPSAATAAATR